MRKRKTWIISDTHFNHRRIIEYENRPFSSIEEMNQTLIDNWNSVVERHDLVYCLGDVFGRMSEEEMTDVLNQLNGEIILVCGNHDKQNFDFFRKSGRFLEVVRPKDKLIVDDWIILSHHPVYLESRSPFINIFGHVHGNPNFATLSPRGACVCVERWNYTPVDYDELLKKIKREKIKNGEIEATD